MNTHIDNLVMLSEPVFIDYVSFTKKNKKRLRKIVTIAKNAKAKVC